MKRSISLRTSVLKVLDASSAPLVIVDPKLTIVFVNWAMSEFLGVAREELLGRTSHYHALADPGDPAAAVNRLCPPAEWVLGQNLFLDVLSPAGSGVAMRLEYRPLWDREGQFAGAVGVAVPQPAPEETTAEDPRDPLILHQRLQGLRQELRREFRLEMLWGLSQVARRLRRQVQLAAANNANVLVVGPLGSGRERVARTIHHLGDPASATLLAPLDCSLLDAELLRTTITAFLQQSAELETAGVPVLLLLDVDQLEEPAQRELMDTLLVEELSIRALATAQHPLQGLAREGRYHRALAERLSEFVIELPGLNERREDIPILAQGLIEECNSEGDKSLSGLARPALEVLESALWPGNIGQLKQALRQAFEQASGPWIQVPDLPASVRQSADPRAVRLPARGMLPLDQQLQQVEKRQMQKALRRAKGNKARAARLLGISRPRLLRRLSHFGID